MIDLCLRCRIQAPHRPGRDRCPRCGGPLSKVSSTAEAVEMVAAQRGGGAVPMPSPQAQRPTPPPPPSPAPPRRATRFYQSNHVRWVARRPPETLPAPRPRTPRGPRPIPRYWAVPRWGLHDSAVANGHDAATRPSPRERLTASFLVAAAALAASALAHLLRYILLAVNRSTPLPGWLIIISSALLFVAGVVALLAFVGATAAFTRWLVQLRIERYRAIDRRDPRRRATVVVLAAIPLVNILGAGLLCREVADLPTTSDPASDADDRRRRGLMRMWVTWTLVNAVAVLTFIVLCVAAASGSIQTGANGLLLVVISAAVSAAFAYTAAYRLPALFDEAHAQPVPATRWVAVA